MAFALLPGSVSSSRTFRSTTPGSGASQRLSLGLHEVSVVNKQQNSLRQHHLCHARGRGYRSSSASDWSALFQSLAEMSKSFEAGASEFRSEAQQPSEYSRDDEAGATDSEVPVTVAVDVEEGADGYSLFMDVPGLQKSDVKIQVSPQQRIITISGERNRPEGETAQASSGRRFRRRYERRMGRFSRTLKLAKDLDIKTISARVEKGVLCVTAQKVPAVETNGDTLEISID